MINYELIRKYFNKYAKNIEVIIWFSVIFWVWTQFFKMFIPLGFSFIPFFSWTQCINDWISFLICIILFLIILNIWRFLGRIFMQFIDVIFCNKILIPLLLNSWQKNNYSEIFKDSSIFSCIFTSCNIFYIFMETL
jgi:hypothetical protein